MNGEFREASTKNRRKLSRILTPIPLRSVAASGKLNVNAEFNKAVYAASWHQFRECEQTRACRWNRWNRR